MTIAAHIRSLPNDYVSVVTPYDPAVIAQFRAMPGCQFDRSLKAWVGPEEAVEVVLATLKRAGVVIPVDLRQPKTPPKFPLMFDDSNLFEYQIDGVGNMMLALAARGAVLNADDMGLGKTIQALRTAHAMMVDTSRVLVLCPSIMVPSWIREAKKWLGFDAIRLGLKTKKGKAAQEMWVEGGGIGVMSYDTFRGRDLPLAEILILDELHYLSNPKAQRSKAVARYINSGGKRPYIIGLTGTPMTARPRDLWHPLDLLYPGRFGRKVGGGSFEERYADGRFVEIQGVDRPVWQADGATNLEELGMRLRSGLMVRRTKSEVALELPDRQRILLPVELPTAAQRSLASAYNLAADMTNPGRVLSAIEEHKIKAAIDLTNDLVANGRRVLLFTLRKSTARLLGEALHAPYVTGEDDAEDRAALLQNSPIGVATVYSVTTGLNLVDYDTVVFVGLDWVPSTLLQAEARIHRIGQTRDVLFYYLIGMQTIDEVVASKVIERLDNFNTVVGASEDEAGLAQTLRGNKTQKELLDEIMADVMRMVAA